MTIERWRPTAQLRHRNLRLETPEKQQADIRASSAAIHHVLDVVIDNALLHGDGDVTISGTSVEGGYAIRVSNQGSMSHDPDDLFRKRPPGGSATGRGIGLSLARTLAAAEGAHLHLVNASPTTFELLFANAGNVRV